jgi:superfamily I DNA/RNA helicase
MTDRFEERFLLMPEMAAALGWSLHTLGEIRTAYEAAWCNLSCEDPQWISGNEQKPFLDCVEEVRGFYYATMPGQVIYLLKKLLDEHPIALEELSLRHLLVDEYQDLNRCDHAVLKRLADNGAELFVVGDDDQSIYTRLRHAHPEGVREFRVPYPDSEVFNLPVTHRCPKTVVEVANRLISNDPNRLPKEFRAREDAPEGLVKALQFRTHVEEAASVARLCSWSILNGVPPSQIFVLVSRWALAQPICQALQTTNVPYQLFGPDSPVADRTGRLAYALLRIAAQPTDALAWRTWLHFLPDVGPRLCLALRVGAVEAAIPIWEAIRRLAAGQIDLGKRGRVVAAALPALMQTIVGVGSQSVAVAEQVAAAIDYAETLAGQQAGLREAMSSVIEKASPETLQDLLGLLADPYFQPNEAQRPPAVLVMSMSSAKGLSANTVIVPGLENDLIPTDDPTRESEYRRLLYVSVTRARDKLFLTHSAHRSGLGAYFGSGQGLPLKRRSKFLNEMEIASEIGHRYIDQLVNV